MSTRLNCEKWGHAFLLVLIAATLSCAPAKHQKTEDQQALRAQTEIVRLSTVVDRFEVPGTIKAKIQTTVSSKVVGQIISLPVREGDRVRKGELLVELEGRDASAQLRRAQAGETEARRGLEEVDSSIRAAEAALHAAEASRDLALATRKRYEVLRERRSVSPQEFDEVDTRYRAAASDAERAQQTLAGTQARRSQVLARIQQAEAEVEAGRVALGYLRIMSPINGIVTAKKAESGMLATPGMPLIEVEDDSSYQLESLVEESRAAAVRAGQKVTVQIDAIAATVNAQVSEIVPAGDPTTRTYTVKLDLALAPAIRRNLHSGFFGRASFPAGERQALLIHESALVHRGQLVGVYLVQDNRAVLRLVKSGKRYDDGIEILSGLSTGTKIVTDPAAGVSDGVTIIEDPEGPRL